MCILWYVWGQRTTCGNWASPLTMWGPGIQFTSRAFACWAGSLAIPSPSCLPFLKSYCTLCPKHGWAVAVFFPKEWTLILESEQKNVCIFPCSQRVVLEVALVERGERGCVDEGQVHQDEGSRWHSNISLKFRRLIFWYLGQNLVIYLFWFHPIHQCYMGMVTASTSCA